MYCILWEYSCVCIYKSNFVNTCIHTFRYIPLINTDFDSTQPGISLDSNNSKRNLTDDVAGNHDTYMHTDMFCYPLALCQ